jgi:Reverse transcriptase (RNA-dependent DNA polymerase)
MGIANAPDIFQSKINQLMEGLDYVRAYLDTILIVTKNTYDDHLNKLDTVLQRLHTANLKINIEKSTYVV